MFMSNGKPALSSLMFQTKETADAFPLESFTISLYVANVISFYRRLPCFVFIKNIYLLVINVISRCGLVGIILLSFFMKTFSNTKPCTL